VIEELVWWEANIRKLAEHGITLGEVEAMVERDEYVFRDTPYAGQVRVVGPTADGRLITVAMEVWTDGVYRPVTAWEATAAERRGYHEERR
jgi:uncharacterized DUF497 family protein